MTNDFRESNIVFSFPDNSRVIKLDDCSFYRKYFNRLSGGKGVDFIVDTDKYVLLIEVKNCVGHECENKNRTRTRGVDRAANADGSVNYFEDEIPCKVAMSLACLIGAHTKQENTPAAQELEFYFQEIISESILRLKKDIIIIFVLEGDFQSRTRSKDMIMQRIQSNIRGKLKWLACKKVYVVDTNTYKGRYFSMKFEPVL